MKINVGLVIALVFFLILNAASFILDKQYRDGIAQAHESSEFYRASIGAIETLVNEKIKGRQKDDVLKQLTLLQEKNGLEMVIQSDDRIVLGGLVYEFKENKLVGIVTWY